MSILSGLLQGVNEGVEKQRQEKQKRVDIEAENAKARGMEILKGMIGGDIEETQNPQEAVMSEPGQVIKRGLFGMGKAETTPGKYYKAGNRYEDIPPGFEVSGYTPSGKPYLRKIATSTQSQEQSLKEQNKAQTYNSETVNSWEDVPMAKRILSVLTPSATPEEKKLGGLRPGGLFMPPKVSKSQSLITTQSNSRNRVIQELKAEGYPTTERNIEAAMQQLKK